MCSCVEAGRRRRFALEDTTVKKVCIIWTLEDGNDISKVSSNTMDQKMVEEEKRGWLVTFPARDKDTFLSSDSLSAKGRNLNSQQFVSLFNSTINHRIILWHWEWWRYCAWNGVRF